VALYATPTELAGYLQQDLDTYSATQALTLASAEFSRVAQTVFSATSVTWSSIVDGCTELQLPFNDVTAVSAVRINGVTVTGWTLRLGALYRAAGFGYQCAFPPSLADVDLTYGQTAVPDDAKLGVLEIASGVYEHPEGWISEAIDDYVVRYDPEKKISPAGRPWQDVAADYRGLLIS
jgi:hypothetical protein